MIPHYVIHANGRRTYPHTLLIGGSKNIEHMSTTAKFRSLLPQALAVRQPLIQSGRTQVFRLFSGAADGMDGVFVDVYGPGAVLILYEGRIPSDLNSEDCAKAILETTSRLSVRAVYLKPFAKDRSNMGGELPPEVTDPTPIAGEILPESFVIQEHDWKLEIRLYDGLSTGLFLDQRDNRKFLHDGAKARAKSGGVSVLNTFAYTCAFSVAAAIAGALTTSVDVSGRYLDWGKKSFEHNGIDVTQHRFAKMDTFEFFNYARRKGFSYDAIILDPPSFSAGSKKKGIRPWSSVSDYARLVNEAAGLLNPKGMIFASTNTQELCRPGRLDREIIKALGKEPRWLKLPPPAIDFARDRDRFAARAFTLS